MHPTKSTQKRRLHLVSQARTAAIFFFSLLFWELMLRIVTGASILTAYPLLFLAAASLFLTTFAGWFKSGANHACVLILLTLLLIYYGAQLVYFRIFGSMFSVSMLGLGGDAVKNFGWALRHSMIESIWWILLFCLPVAAYTAWLIIKKPTFHACHLLVHCAVLTIAISCWLLGAAALSLGGTDRHTAYDAYHNSHTDTDTASAKLGVLPTTIIELGSPFFGRESDSSAILVPQASTMPDAFEVTTEPGNKNTDISVYVEDSVEDAEPEPLDTSPNVIDAIDFKQLASMTEDEDIKALCEYFATVEGTNRNEFTGLLEGYNLIYICAEAFSTAAIHPEVTPTLYKLSTGGIVLNNFYNSFINTTTNGEFAFMTGLWPDVSRIADEGSYTGSFSQSATRHMPFGLGNLFSVEGVKSFAFHNYAGNYYNRRATHANLGYTCKFMDAGMTFSTSWPSSDFEMMEQSVDDFINEDRFNVYYMTFSGHGPYAHENSITYKNYDKVIELTNGYDYPYYSQCYLANSLELEYAMQYLMQRLEEAGKADNTLIVLTGDHYPYYLSHKYYDALVGKPENEAFGYYKSSCIMWCGGLEEPIVSDTYCCTVDILPTVLNLMGIEYDSRLLAGRDIFSDGEHIAVLYDKSYLNEYVWYEAPYRTPTWQMDISSISEDSLSEYLNYITAVIDARYAASLKIIETDFYRFVWENSGLMPDQTVSPPENSTSTAG